MTGLQLHARACCPLQVVSLRGQLDLTEADDTAATLTSLAAGGRRVIADLAALEFIDCYALRALAQARDQARQQGGDILLAAPPPIVTQMLELTGLGAALAVHASVTAAAGRQDRLEKLVSRGIFLREAGRFDEAIGAHQAAVHTARQAGDQPGETVALVSLGFTLREAGRLDEAIGAHQAAVHTARQAGDRQTEADALGSLGIFLREAGRVAEAICAHRAAAITARETGDPQIEAEALYDLGISQREAGRVDEAISAYQETVDLY
jgi:anti-anti-sigma factor